MPVVVAPAQLRSDAAPIRHHVVHLGRYGPSLGYAGTVVLFGLLHSPLEPRRASVHDSSLIPYGNEPEGMGGEPGRGRCWDRFEWDADVVLNGRWRQPRRRVVRCCPLRITGGWSCGACGREARECGQAVGNASALSTGCPHGPQGSRRSVGLVHKSTGFSPCRGVANRSTRRGAQCVHAALVSRRSMSRNSWSRAALTSRAAARSSSATATLSSCSKVTPGRR